MEEKLVPNVIGWLVRYGDVSVIYGVVRDMPWLLEKKVDWKATVASSSSSFKGEDIPVLEKEESMIVDALVEENEDRVGGDVMTIMENEDRVGGDDLMAQ